MKVAIIGAGGVACSYAAFLAQGGHRPVIWSPSGRRARELASGEHLTASGSIEGQFAVQVAASEVFVTAADVVIFAVPAFAHRSLMDRLAPHLHSGQTVIVSAHLSFSALYLSRVLVAQGKACPIVVWNTTASTGRQSGPTQVSVSLLRRQVEMAVIPDEKGPAALDLCRALFADRFALRQDIVGVDLGNLNPAVHYALAMFNLTRIEKAETWAQQQHLTPAVCRFLEDVDRERLAVAEALGAEARSIHQAYAIPEKVEVGPLAEMIEKIVQLRRGVNGPTSLETRYVTEDVPYGLVTTVRLAEMAKIEVPLHRAGILLFSSLYGRDFAAENDLLGEIEDAFASIETLRRIAARGWPAASRGWPAT